jgi:hypothetical protein
LSTVEPRQILRSGITASALAHLSCLLLVIFFAEVHPFGTVTAEPIAVDIVASDEIAKKPESKPESPELPPKEKEKPFDSLDLSSKLDPSAKAASSAATASSPPPAATPPPAASAAAATKPAQAAAPPPSPQQQAALAPPTPPQPAAPAPAKNPTPVPGLPPAVPQQVAPTQPAQPAYSAPQPDLSLKYHVLLGLPQNRPGDGFDAPATEKADVGNDSIAEFRQHLKTCSTLPKDVSPSDKVAIKLRVRMSPDGRLAAQPVLIEASASMKGPLLMQSAISALEACQPYAMLPADKYPEWKTLDLVFTPQDFTGAS